MRGSRKHHNHRLPLSAVDVGSGGVAPEGRYNGIGYNRWMILRMAERRVERPWRLWSRTPGACKVHKCSLTLVDWDPGLSMADQPPQRREYPYACLKCWDEAERYQWELRGRWAHLVEGLDQRAEIARAEGEGKGK